MKQNLDTENKQPSLGRGFAGSATKEEPEAIYNFISSMMLAPWGELCTLGIDLFPGGVNTLCVAPPFF
jgi:hypothetical protein